MIEPAHWFGLGLLVATTCALLLIVWLGVAACAWARGWARRFERVHAERRDGAIHVDACFRLPKVGL